MVSLGTQPANRKSGFGHSSPTGARAQDLSRQPARPDLWGARVSNDPGLPDHRTGWPAIVAHVATGRADVAEHGHPTGPTEPPSQEAGRHPPPQPLHKVLPLGIDRLGANPVLLRHLRPRPLIGRAEEHATTGGAARENSASRVRSAVLGPGRGGLIQPIRSPMFPVRFIKCDKALRDVSLGDHRRLV